MLSMIVAHDEARAIGRAGGMPWHVPEDLRFFRRTTLGKPIIMGRGTWGSIGEKPLPGRQNFVVTSKPGLQPDVGVAFISLSDAHEIIASHKDEIFCIGGGRLYGELMPRADRLYVTKLAMRAEGPDTWFPEYREDSWELVATEDLMASDIGAVAYTYQRRDFAQR